MDGAYPGIVKTSHSTISNWCYCDIATSCILDAGGQVFPYVVVFINSLSDENRNLLADADVDREQLQV